MTCEKVDQEPKKLNQREFIKTYMGRKVRFSKIVVKERRDSYVHQMEHPANGEGWVTGYRYVSFGKAEWHGDDASFTSQGSRLVVLVAQWPTMRPVRVPLDAIELLPEDHEIKNPTASHWSPQDREDQRNAMEGAKRDENGRWV